MLLHGSVAGSGSGSVVALTRAEIESERHMELEEQDLFAAAHKSFEFRQFDRAVHLLRECTSRKARFLSIYSRFIVGSENDYLFSYLFDLPQGQ